MRFALVLLFIFFSHFAFGQNGEENFSDEEIITDEEIAEVVPPNPLQKISDLGYKDLDFNALQDERVVVILQDIFKDSPLSKISPQEVRELILTQSKGKFFHGYLEKSPKLMKTLVEILQDKEALPAMLGLLLKKKEIEIFFYVWIGLVGGTWAIKRFWVKKKKKWSKSKKFFVSMLISFASSAISLGTFYYLFYEEVSPVTKIAFMNWRKRNLP